MITTGLLVLIGFQAPVRPANIVITMPLPAVIREFVGLHSADHYFATPGTRDEQADVIANWIGARW